MFSRIEKAYRVVKNYKKTKKNKETEKEYRALHSLHRIDFYLQHAKEADGEIEDKPSDEDA